MQKMLLSVERGSHSSPSGDGKRLSEGSRCVVEWQGPSAGAAVDKTGWCPPASTVCGGRPLAGRAPTGCHDALPPPGPSAAAGAHPLRHHANRLDNGLETSNRPSMRTSAGWLVLGLALVLRARSLSHAYFLDQGRHFD